MKMKFQVTVQLLAIFVSLMSFVDCKISGVDPPPRPYQKSLLLVFDSTGSMSSELVELRGAVQEIVSKQAGRNDSTIYNYILSVFNDPGWLQNYFVLVLNFLIIRSINRS